MTCWVPYLRDSCHRHVSHLCMNSNTSNRLQCIGKAWGESTIILMRSHVHTKFQSLRVASKHYIWPWQENVQKQRCLDTRWDQVGLQTQLRRWMMDWRLLIWFWSSSYKWECFYWELKGWCIYQRCLYRTLFKLVIFDLYLKLNIILSFLILSA